MSYRVIFFKQKIIIKKNFSNRCIQFRGIKEIKILCLTFTGQLEVKIVLWYDASIIDVYSFYENEFSPLHEKNSRILAIDLWGKRKEKEKKGKLKGRDWRNWEN
jgi:hypothetical protein